MGGNQIQSGVDTAESGFQESFLDRRHMNCILGIS